MIRGCDFSHHNGNVDFKAVKASGVDFCFCKATQGTTFTDPTFQRNMKQGHDAGILMGAYHFFDPRKDAVEQALHYMEQLKTVPRPVLICGDFEWIGKPGEPEPWGTFDNQERTAMVDLFLDTLLEAYRTKPFLYTSIAFHNEYLQSVATGFYPIWIARYKPGELPPGWALNTEIHQYSEKGDIPGAPGPFEDMNRSRLTLAELTDLAVKPA